MAVEFAGGKPAGRRLSTGRWPQYRRAILIRNLALGLLVVAAGLAACQRGPELVQSQSHVFGTTVTVSIWTDQPKAASDATAEVLRRFDDWHYRWHAWKAGEVTDINRALAAGKAAPISPLTGTLIEVARPLAEASGQRFNPAIGGLVGLWGFHRDDFPFHAAPPEQAAIQTWIDAQPRLTDLEIDSGEIRSRNASVQLDFGGFAKGFAIDRAMAMLAEQGFNDVLIDTGGDLRGRGSKGDRPWRIGIRHPATGEVLAGLTVQGDEAIFTSGNYRRYLQHGDLRYPHILNPATGRPVQYIASATVIAGTGATADAAATALMVAGPDQWREVADAMDIDAALVVTETGDLQTTPAMADRLINASP